MLTVTIDEAQARLPQLIEAAARGEQILILQTNKPAALLVSIPGSTAVRRPGAMKGKITIADDFDANLSLLLKKSFE